MTDDTAANRLRQARETAGFSSAAHAARVHAWQEGTYRHHENGTRNIPPKAAAKYGDAFGVSAGWILGLNPGPKRSISEELQSALFTDDEVNSVKDFYERLASQYGLALLKSVPLSKLDEAGTSTEFDERDFAIDIRVLEQIAPGRSSTPLTFLAVHVDRPTDTPHIAEGAVLIVDRAAAMMKRLRATVLYRYAGFNSIHTMYRHADNTVEMLNVGRVGESVRLNLDDVSFWGEVLWVGQPPE